jgi:hypothetical protein
MTKSIVGLDKAESDLILNYLLPSSSCRVYHWWLPSIYSKLGRAHSSRQPERALHPVLPVPSFAEERGSSSGYLQLIW